MIFPAKAETADRSLRLWLAVGWIGFAVFPWYVIEDGFWGLSWLADGFPFDSDTAPAAFLLAMGEKIWLAPVIFFLGLPLLALGRRKTDPVFAKILLIAGIGGLTYLTVQGFAIGIRGWNGQWLIDMFGTLGDRQFGLGYGAGMAALAFLFFFHPWACGARRHQGRCVCCQRYRFCRRHRGDFHLLSDSANALRRSTGR